MYKDTWHTFHLWGLQTFLALHGSSITGFLLRESDCHLTFHSCDRQLLKSCFTQMGCCNFIDSHLILCSPACNRIRTAGRRTVNNWGVSLRICEHTGFPPPSLSSTVSIALAGYKDSAWWTGTSASVNGELVNGRRQETRPLPLYLFACSNCLEQRPAWTGTSAAARRR